MLCSFHRHAIYVNIHTKYVNSQGAIKKHRKTFNNGSQGNAETFESENDMT